MQIKDMKTMFRFSNNIEKIILRGAPGSWVLTAYMAPLFERFETLETARGGNRIFKSLDSAYEIAKELDDIFSENNDKSLSIEIHPE